jgi:hypothetical protein
MDRHLAARLVTKWLTLISDQNHPWDEEHRSGHYRELARKALWTQLTDLVPDPDHAVAYLAGDRDPAIAVLKGNALYLLRVRGFDGERALAECRHVTINPDHCRASVVSQHWSDDFDTATGSDWRFDIDHIGAIAVRTKSSTDDDLPSEALFCRALAAVIGWDVPAVESRAR